MPTNLCFPQTVILSGVRRSRTQSKDPVFLGSALRPVDVFYHG